ncbi:hypothetical protein ABID42_003893 [Arcicella rosea]|uniref:hypothetical protein n=1 Tax=Arcicella rosea TaxID=502909 RepID=UPI00345DE9A3
MNLIIKNSFSTVVSYFAIILVICFFYFICYSYSFNFFFQDDYHLLCFVNTTHHSQLSFGDKLKALWSLHNEHRIVFPRLFVLIGDYFQGHIDWKVLNTIATLYYLGIFIIFAKFLQQMKLAIWYLVPVAFYIFQPACTENYLWTISTLQQVGNIFWAMLLFYTINFFKKKYFWVSILLVIILTFTHGNGLFSFPVVALILIFQKRFKALAIWLSLMIFIAVIYFWGYQNGQNSNLAGSLSNPVRLLLCFGAFWGSFISVASHSLGTFYLAIALGFFVFIILSFFNVKTIYINSLYLFKKDDKRLVNNYLSNENLFLLASFLFFSITALLVALSRSWSGLESSFANRYLHNSYIIFVLFYCGLLCYLPKFRVLIGNTFLVTGLLFNLFAWYQNFDKIIFQKHLNQSEAYNYQHNKTTIENVASFNRNISVILAQSFQNGVSIFPENYLNQPISVISTDNSDVEDKYKVEISKDSSILLDAKKAIYLPKVLLKNTQLDYQGQAFVLFKSPKNTYVYPVYHQKSGRRKFLQMNPYFTAGFYTSVLLDSFEKNTYQIGIVQKINNRIVCHFTKQTIVIQ